MNATKAKRIVLLISSLLLACTMTQHGAKQNIIPTATARITLFPTATLTRIANPTTIPSTPTSTTQSTACTPRSDWSVYTVLAGDTLGSLAQRSGTSVNALSTANCLINAGLIYVGQQLYLPVPLFPTTPPKVIDVPTLPAYIVGGRIRVSPVLRSDSDWQILRAGSTVTLTWEGAERLGAVEVHFTLIPTGSGASPAVVADDYDTSDGVSAQWTVPSDAGGYLIATAGTLGGCVLVDQTQYPVGIRAEADGTGRAEVISFNANPGAVVRGGTLTLSWTTSGATGVQIVRFTENNVQINDAWGFDLPANGSIQYTLPSPNYIDHISFTVFAKPSGASKRLDIELVCPFTSTLWFGCPVTQQTAVVAFQFFDNGRMVGRRDIRKVYVLFDDGGWLLFDDTWQDNEPIYPSMPENGSIPCMGKRPDIGSFAKLWMTQPNVQERLGCTTQPTNTFSTLWEEYRAWDGNTPKTTPVFRWSDGRLVNFGLQTWHIQD